jgi:hypothetical protein
MKPTELINSIKGLIAQNIAKEKVEDLPFALLIYDVDIDRMHVRRAISIPYDTIEEANHIISKRIWEFVGQGSFNKVYLIYDSKNKKIVDSKNGAINNFCYVLNYNGFIWNNYDAETKNIDAWYAGQIKKKTESKTPAQKSVDNDYAPAQGWSKGVNQ